MSLDASKEQTLSSVWWRVWYGLLIRIARPRKNHVEAAHFQTQTNPDKAALLFKRSVRAIELEISSYCNRVCSYCPNAFIDRRSAQNFMDDGVFVNLLGALARIRYSGVIRLHRYNEPLADREYAIKRIRQIREAIPDAKLEIYTNGDYLNRDYVEQLRDLGVHMMYVNAHVIWDEYNEEKGWEYLSKLIDKLGFEYAANQRSNNAISFDVFTGGTMKLIYAMQNFMGDNSEGNVSANDRGQSLDISKNYRRTAPCLRQFDELQVEYNGTLAPCCHIRTDVPKNRQMALGRITEDNDPFLEWANGSYAAWRRSMVTYDLKDPPCNTCDYKPTGENSKLRTWAERVKAEQNARSS